MNVVVALKSSFTTTRHQGYSTKQ